MKTTRKPSKNTFSQQNKKKTWGNAHRTQENDFFWNLPWWDIIRHTISTSLHWEKKCLNIFFSYRNLQCSPYSRWMIVAFVPIEKDSCEFPSHDHEMLSLFCRAMPIQFFQEESIKEIVNFREIPLLVLSIVAKYCWMRPCFGRQKSAKINKTEEACHLSQPICDVSLALAHHYWALNWWATGFLSFVDFCRFFVPLVDLQWFVCVWSERFWSLPHGSCKKAGRVSLKQQLP